MSQPTTSFMPASCCKFRKNSWSSWREPSKDLLVFGCDLHDVQSSLNNDNVHNICYKDLLVFSCDLHDVRTHTSTTIMLIIS
jgi:hypothetical protein